VHLDLTEQEQHWRKYWRAIAAEVIAPCVPEIEMTAKLPDKLLNDLGERNTLKPFLPQDLGGEGLGLFHLTILLEEFGRHSPAVAWLAAQQVIIGIRTNLKSFNFPDHKELARQAADFKAIFSLAATELEAGCDLWSLSTQCLKLDDGSFEISGGKSHVNWAQKTRMMITLARSDDGKGSTLALIPHPSARLTVGEPHPTLGMAGLEAAPVSFEHLVIPAGHVAGVPGFGHELYDQMVNEMRIAVSALATGLAQEVFDRIVVHAKARKQFGKPIGSFQSLQWRFSDAAMKIEASRLHVWQAVELASSKVSCFQQAAMAKIFATEAACWVADFGVQVMGSKAYIKPNPVERMFRDSRFLKIALGTSEILRNKIAERL